MLIGDFPSSVELFRAYLSMYWYDKTSLNATVEHLDKADEDWSTEKITYTATYENEQRPAALATAAAIIAMTHVSKLLS